MKSNFKYLLIWGVMIIVLIFTLTGVLNVLYANEPTYADIVEYFENIGTDKPAVKEFELGVSNELTMTTTDGKRITFIIQDRKLFYDDCYVHVQEYNKNAEQNGLEKLKYHLEEPSITPVWLVYLPYILIIVALIVAFFLFFGKNSGSSKSGGGPRINSFGKSKARIATPDEKNRIYFKDVAGADEEKEELVEIVDFLKDPSKFTKLGAKIPHGVLLMGPPGTGKTLLAKAVAGEAGVPFYSISGSDFVEMYVGVGASRVRDLFDTARKSSPSIVFIDEIDAVGRHRGAGLGGGHDEREQTLNQLLVEMDGFSGNDGVIVMAATNRPDILDPALLRPGRFDRQITVNYPDLKGREEILRIHARNKPLSSDVDLSVVAKSTVGFTGADLANLLNEAALLAARRGKSLVGMDEIEDSTMKIIVGTQKKSMKIKESERKKTAYHEAGHAIVSYVLPTQDPVHQISVIPSGKALGYTLNLPQEDKYSVYRNELYEEISVLLAGRAAERLIFDDFSGGASNDIQRATNIARKMITKLGMSDNLGPIVYGTDQEEVFLGRDFSHTANYSDETAHLIDTEIKTIIENAYNVAYKILTDNLDKLHFIADYLVSHETIEEAQFKAIMEGNPTVEDLENMESERMKRTKRENDEQEKKNREKEEAERKAQEERAKELESIVNGNNLSEVPSDSGEASGENVFETPVQSNENDPDSKSDDQDNGNGSDHE